MHKMGVLSAAELGRAVEWLGEIFQAASARPTSSDGTERLAAAELDDHARRSNAPAHLAAARDTRWRIHPGSQSRAWSPHPEPHDLRNARARSAPRYPGACPALTKPNKARPLSVIQTSSPYHIPHPHAQVGGPAARLMRPSLSRSEPSARFTLDRWTINPTVSSDCRPTTTAVARIKRGCLKVYPSLFRSAGLPNARVDVAWVRGDP